MPDEQKDVNAVEPSATEQVVDNAVETTQQEEVSETKSEATETQTEAGQPSVEAVDESGVPYKNRYFEFKRKNEELAERLPQMISEAVSQSVGRQQQPQYTEEQLEVFAEQTDNPTHKQWAKGEIKKLQEEKQRELIRGEFEKIQKKQTDEVTRRGAYEYVAKNYSEAFQRDPNGNPMGWNEKHPLTRMIAQLLENPDLKNRPDGIAIAADIAYGRYAKQQGSSSQQKTTQLKREVKNLQKKTLVEGGGKDTVSSVPAHRAAIEKLSQTGSMKDAQIAIREILNAKKASEE